MLTEQRNATNRSDATSPHPPVSEEDWFRQYNAGWRDTAVGRAVHVASCPNTSHRNCGGAQ